MNTEHKVMYLTVQIKNMDLVFVVVVVANILKYWYFSALLLTGAFMFMVGNV